MIIKALTNDNKSDLHTPNQPFDVVGFIELSFKEGKWQNKECISDKPFEKQYPDYDGAKAEDYINSKDRVAYLCYDDNECTGQILLCKSWNNYVHIEDISVSRSCRGRGIGTALLQKAENWALEQGFFALSLECQDNNILASRFLLKNGFEIGGVNTRLYSMLGMPYSNERAVFWYKNIK